jgi:hypothetical protein
MSSSGRPMLIRVGTGRGFVVEGSLAEYGTRYIVTCASNVPPIKQADPDPVERQKPSNLERWAIRALTTVSDPLAAMGRPRLEEKEWLPFTWSSGNRPSRNILGPVGAGRLSVAAQCIFYDTINDIAVLGSPGDSEFDGHELQEAFEQLTTSVGMLKVGELTGCSETDDENWREAPVLIPSLKGELIACEARYSEELFGSRGVPTSIGWDVDRSGRNEDEWPPYNPFPAHYGEGFGELLGSPIFGPDGTVVGVLNGMHSGACLSAHLPRWLFREFVSASTVDV